MDSLPLDTIRATYSGFSLRLDLRSLLLRLGGERLTVAVAKTSRRTVKIERNTEYVK